MKKLFLTIFLLVSLCRISFAAIADNTVFEVRTTGDANNGGGYAGSPFVPRPDAPTVTKTTGGSIANGTYYVVVAYYDRRSWYWSDDAYTGQASEETAVTISDSTNDAIIVTSPAPTENAKKYKVFIGTTSGGPYYAQHTGHAQGTNIGTNWTGTTTPLTSGIEPYRTDYSQQDTAQLTLTDIACNNSSTITSATGGFTQEMIGNILKVTAGTDFTVGYYQIMSVPNTNTAVLDRKPTSTTDAETNGTIYVGGATNHPATIASGIGGSSTVYIKSGTYQKVGAATTVLTTAVNSSNGHGIWWIGYVTSRTTETLGDDRPLFDGNSAATNALYSSGRQTFCNLRFSGATSHGVNLNNSSSRFVNCKSSSNGGAGINSDTQTFLFGTEVNNNSVNGVNGGVNALYSYIHDNTGVGSTKNNGALVNNIFDSNSTSALGDGINNFMTVGNIFYNNPNAAMQSNGDEPADIGFVVNNIFSSNGYALYENGASTQFLLFNNSFYGNTTNFFGTIIFPNTNNITTDPAFANAASADFTVGAASPVIGAGFDMSKLGILATDFNVNIGVDQSDHVTAGGGNVIIIEED